MDDSGQKTYLNNRDCEHGSQRGKCVHCDLDDALATIGRLAGVKKTIEAFVRSEQQIVMRHKKLFSIAPEEIRATHRLEAFQTALGCFPDYI